MALGNWKLRGLSYEDKAKLDANLGTFTWAGLQTAAPTGYPNGSAALAALPAGVTAFVSDWGALFTPNPAKTRWRPVGGKVITQSFTPVANIVNDNTIKFMTEAVWPAGLLEIGGMCAISVNIQGSGDTNNKIFRGFINASSGATGGNQPTPAANLASLTNFFGQWAWGFIIEATGPTFTFTGTLPYTVVVNQSLNDSLTLAINSDTAPVYLAITGQLPVASTSMSINGGFAYYVTPRS
jgi:hypothetical protein